MDKLIKLVAVLVAAALAYVTWQSVAVPVQFDDEQAKREVVLQKQLKKIATYQEAYENLYHKYASAEELTNFLNHGKMYYVTADGEYTDAMREQGLTEKQAAAKGLIRRDTTWIATRDTLLKDGTDVATLFDVLNTGNKITIETASIEQVIGKDTIHRPVMRATIPFEAYLGDLDKKLLQNKVDAANLKKNGYAGLRLGSLTENRMSGNWE